MNRDRRDSIHEYWSRPFQWSAEHSCYTSTKIHCARHILLTVNIRATVPSLHPGPGCQHLWWKMLRYVWVFPVEKGIWASTDRRATEHDPQVWCLPGDQLDRQYVLSIIGVSGIISVLEPWCAQLHPGWTSSWTLGSASEGASSWNDLHQGRTSSSCAACLCSLQRIHRWYGWRWQ